MLKKESPENKYSSVAPEMECGRIAQGKNVYEGKVEKTCEQTKQETL